MRQLLNVAYLYLSRNVKGGEAEVDRMLHGDRQLPADLQRRQNRNALTLFAGMGAQPGTVR